ncbi:MAG: phosphotransferase [Patescibacteria group bacterium]|nr:phosphotransferase [Patescibacteria group bacterium]
MKYFKQTKNKKVMRHFFNLITKQYYPPGSKLKKIEIHDQSGTSFKKALKYILKIKLPSGKEVRKIIRGNVPSRDTREESYIADRTKKMLFQKDFVSETCQIPFPLGYYKKLNLVLYEEFPGKPFACFINKRKRIKEITRKSAYCLARLHNMRIKNSKKKKLSEIKDEISYFKEDYKNNYPDVYAFGASLLDNLFPLIKNEIFKNKKKFILTHGDFNPNNIIVCGKKTALIDWGRSNLFDPLSDMGNFFAQLNIFNWCENISQEKIKKIKLTFRHKYLQERNITYQAIKRKLIIHELWWMMQIMAYTVSTRDPHVSQLLVNKTLEKARKYANWLGLEINEDILKTKKYHDLKKIFKDKEIMMKLYCKGRRKIFPQAKNIIDLEIEHPKALSQTSFLTRTKITYTNKKNKPEEITIRGNTINKNTFQIMEYVYKKNKKNLISPRPLYYFPVVPYLLYEEVPGKPLRKISFNSAKFARLVKKSALALANLHKLKPQGIKKRNLKEKEYFKELRKKIKKYDPKNKKIIFKYVRLYHKKIHPSFRKSKRVLTHNDFQASNIIVTPENKIAIIDFTLSSMFYPSFDLACFITHLRIMLADKVSHKKIEKLQKSFLNTYLKKMSKARVKQIKKNLGLAQVRAALDIWAITATLMGKNDKNRQKYVNILNRIIKTNLK